MTGRAIGITDGDTFTLLTGDKQQIKIRLAEIDAPESAQPYGNRSKQALSGLIFGKDVQVAVQTIDRYGRTVGRPYVGELDVCEEMIRSGSAWVYRQYVVDKDLFEIESEAKTALRGLWSLPNTSESLPGIGDEENARQPSIQIRLRRSLVEPRPIAVKWSVAKRRCITFARAVYHD